MKQKSKDLLEKPNQNQRAYPTSQGIDFHRIPDLRGQLVQSFAQLISIFLRSWLTRHLDSGWLAPTELKVKVKVVVTPSCCFTFCFSFFFGGARIASSHVGNMSKMDIFWKGVFKKRDPMHPLRTPRNPIQLHWFQTFTLITGSGKSIFSKTIGASTAHKVSPWTMVTIWKMLLAILI